MYRALTAFESTGATTFGAPLVVVRTALLLGVAGLVALPSRADLVLKDSSYGPGTIIEDTVTHLDWLKLTVTQNRSFDDVSSKFGPGEEFAGFQYGDVVQVGQLFKDGGLPSIVPSDTFPFGNASAGIIGNHDLFGLGPDEIDVATLAVQTTFACAAVHCAIAHPLNGGASGPGIRHESAHRASVVKLQREGNLHGPAGLKRRSMVLPASSCSFQPENNAPILALRLFDDD